VASRDRSRDDTRQLNPYEISAICEETCPEPANLVPVWQSAGRGQPRISAPEQRPARLRLSRRRSSARRMADSACSSSSRSRGRSPMPNGPSVLPHSSPRRCSFGSDRRPSGTLGLPPDERVREPVPMLYGVRRCWAGAQRRSGRWRGSCARARKSASGWHARHPLRRAPPAPRRPSTRHSPPTARCRATR
jgi:hypothetical protein